MTAKLLSSSMTARRPNR